MDKETEDSVSDEESPFAEDAVETVATDSEESENNGMPLLSHLEELRYVLIKCLSVFTFFCVLVLIFSVGFADLLYWPLHQAYDLMGLETPNGGLITRRPMSVFSVIIQLGFFGGLGLSLPFIVYFVSTFIAPGLTQKEKKLLKPACLAILVLFLSGAAFSFFLILPMALAFSLKLNDMFGFQNLWDPANYFGMVVWMSIGLGLLFQFPLVLVLLQHFGIVTTERLKEYRRHAVVFIMILAALITPGGDPITLVILGIPLYLLYEAALLIGEKFVKPVGDDDFDYDDEEHENDEYFDEK